MNEIKDKVEVQKTLIELIDTISSCKSIEALYEISNEIQDCIKILNPDMNCQSGCSNCCKIAGSPLTHPAEWEKIKEFISEDKELLTNIKTSFKAVRASLRKKLQKKNFLNSVEMMTQNICPFLQNEKCSVYDVRPVTCRMFGNIYMKNMVSPTAYNIYTCEMERNRWKKTNSPVLPVVDDFNKPLLEINEGMGGPKTLLFLLDRFFKENE